MTLTEIHIVNIANVSNMQLLVFNCTGCEVSTFSGTAVWFNTVVDNRIIASFVSGGLTLLLVLLLIILARFLMCTSTLWLS